MSAVKKFLNDGNNFRLLNNWLISAAKLRARAIGRERTKNCFDIQQSARLSFLILHWKIRAGGLPSGTAGLVAEVQLCGAKAAGFVKSLARAKYFAMRLWEEKHTVVRWMIFTVTFFFSLTRLEEIKISPHDISYSG